MQRSSLCSRYWACCVHLNACCAASTAVPQLPQLQKAMTTPHSFRTTKWFRSRRLISTSKRRRHPAEGSHRRISSSSRAATASTTKTTAVVSNNNNSTTTQTSGLKGTPMRSTINTGHQNQNGKDTVVAVSPGSHRTKGRLTTTTAISSSNSSSQEVDSIRVTAAAAKSQSRLPSP